MKTWDEIIQEYEAFKEESEAYLDRYNVSKKDASHGRVQRLAKYNGFLKLVSHMRELPMAKKFQLIISHTILYIYESSWKRDIVFDCIDSETFIVFLGVDNKEAHLHPYMMRKFKLSELETVLEEYVDLAKKV